MDSGAANSAHNLPLGGTPRWCCICMSGTRCFDISGGERDSLSMLSSDILTSLLGSICRMLNRGRICGIRGRSGKGFYPTLRRCSIARSRCRLMVKHPRRRRLPRRLKKVRVDNLVDPAVNRDPIELFELHLPPKTVTNPWADTLNFGRIY